MTPEDARARRSKPLQPCHLCATLGAIAWRRQRAAGRLITNVGLPHGLDCRAGDSTPIHVRVILGTVATRHRETDPAYVIRDGPLKGGYVSVISVDDQHDRVRAIVGGEHWLTPPIFVARSQLKKIPSGFWLLPRWAQVCVFGVLISVSVFFATHSIVPLLIALICLGGCVTHFVRGEIYARRLKTCPLCGAGLDPDTWSRCSACGWNRPMPAFLDSEVYDPDSLSASHRAPTRPDDDPS
jgi:hypothetical protein